jgi:hypothetical protein
MKNTEMNAIGKKTPDTLVLAHCPVIGLKVIYVNPMRNIEDPLRPYQVRKKFRL